MGIPNLLFTDNFSKAMVLISLGVPLLTHAGEIAKEGDCPEFRTIRDEDLDENGWDSIEKAERAGFVGHITYAFGEHRERKSIIRAFEKAHTAPKTYREVPDTLQITAADGKKVTVKYVELMAAFGAVLFRNRKKFADRRTKVKAKLFYTKQNGLPSIIDRRSSDNAKETLSR